jgi:hypothetical protein
LVRKKGNVQAEFPASARACRAAPWAPQTEGPNLMHLMTIEGPAP